MAATLTAPRWTHIALPSSDIDKAVDFYTRYTPLVVLSRREDEAGVNVWLSHEGQVEAPFVLVLVMLYKDAGRAQPTMAPFAHLGIEVPSRTELDALAEQARSEGCLVWEPRDMPSPIGYICGLADPDGNIVEISFGQGVFDAVGQRWGPPVPHTRP